MILVFEGNFGLGKSTLIKGIKEWFTSNHQDFVISEWNSVPEIRDTYTKIDREIGLHHPQLYCYFQLLDLIYRHDHQIAPALEAGSIVLCDRYIHTLFVRAMVRNLDPSKFYCITDCLISPNYIFYLDGGAELTIKRIGCRGEMRNEVWAVGIDMECDRKLLNNDAYYDHIQKNLNHYRKIMHEANAVWINAEASPGDQISIVMNFLKEELKQHE